MASYFNSLGISKDLISASILEKKWKKARKHSVCQSRESRGIFDETETREMGPRRDQSRGLESRLQRLVHTRVNKNSRQTQPKTCLYAIIAIMEWP